MVDAILYLAFDVEVNQRHRGKTALGLAEELSKRGGNASAYLQIRQSLLNEGGTR